MTGGNRFKDQRGPQHRKVVDNRTGRERIVEESNGLEGVSGQRSIENNSRVTTTTDDEKRNHA